MRPVRLEMAGFASFREPTVVDFTGADYFALVGPTGSGKSTVIDAITFALYGSVPRWDNQRTVALALAPTAGRGTVRLLFDVGGARYVVARELRRAASGAVSVRSARLEKLRDRAGTGAVDEDTEPLADGAGGVTAAVEALLGLPFGDFTTCVVLPQGDFAEFLHTEPRKRQEKLVRILGLGIYDQIAREANTDAAAQRQRVEVLTEQLVQYADATPSAEQAAAERVAALEALADRVAASVPQIAAAEADVAAAEADAAQVRADGVLLAGLVAPGGDLDARRAAAAAAVEQAIVRAAAADDADTAARQALATVPDRGRLERTRAEHAELARRTAEQPGLHEHHEKVRALLDTATRDAADARTALDTARAARESAAAAARVARERVATVTEERDRLRSLAVPAGLDELDDRRNRAVAALDRATAALDTAESADTRARDEQAAAPARAPLEQARRERAELADVQRARRESTTRLASVRRTNDEATARAEGARHTLEHAEAATAAALRADLVGALRPALELGAACPVCAQAVATLPAPLPAGDLAGAEAAAAAAAGEHDVARLAEGTAATALARVTAEVERLDQQAERLRRDLAAAPPDVDGALLDLDRREGEVQRADLAVRAARRDRETAARAVDTVRADVSGAAAALQSARDPLVPFGAPAVGDDVSAGWTGLVGWATGQAAERESALAAAQTDVTTVEAAHRATGDALGAADRVATERRHDETAAARAEQEIAVTVGAVASRLDELGGSLDGAPTDAEAARELQRCAECEAAARVADTALRVARTALRDAERTVTGVGREVTAAWQALRAARDPLVPLGAPAVHGDDLGAAWNTLAGWAQTQVGDRRRQFTAAETAARTARAVRAAAHERLTADLAAHQLTAASPTAPSTVAAALERARGAGERIVERRAVAARIVTDRDLAEEAAQVAKMLGGLLRSDGFPRWLVASALDALVADASTSLAELSGGQFALTHDHGEFLVIDHADADARRPVKTLSGGETFQASLALALALSAQMAGLAAQGAARLDSIFLDEGFGTLDEANLETVAGTLENLAARGDRMVGLVTHVPALAERVPVRFRVRRDQVTSSVERENL